MTYDIGLILGLFPIVATTSGRWWRWLIATPITVVPIAMKTMHQLVNDEHVISPTLGCTLYVILPMAITISLAIRLGRSVRRDEDLKRANHRWVTYALFASVWIYFGLNFAFFRFPWPWSPWTYRTPNGIIYVIFGTLLTTACMKNLRRKKPETA